MSVKRNFCDWLAASRSGEDPVFAAPRVTVQDMRELAAGAGAVLSGRKEQRIAFAFADPVRFLAAFTAVLALRKTPVLFNATDAACRRLKGRFDALFTDRGDLTFENRVLWDGACLKEGALPAASDASEILFFTSGSTGTPKEVRKTVRDMDREADVTCALFGENLEGSAVAASVDPCHLYGLTFFFWCALSAGRPLIAKRIQFPEELTAIKEPFGFVTSPTFLAHLDTALSKPGCTFVLSAGGALSAAALAKAGVWFDVPLSEIYGSTESGVIASRRHKKDEPEPFWRTAPGVTLEKRGEDFVLTSPYVPQPLPLEDRIEPAGAGLFRLKGRRDRIVKIGEKRFSLALIESETAKHFSCEVRILVLEKNGRSAVAAVLKRAKPLTKDQSTEAHSALLKVLNPLAVPRYWRTVAEWPYNAQGKVEAGCLRELFNA
jgi:acyl-coenzyme A synthetase/AMP-(fatty) acid ligase